MPDAEKENRRADARLPMVVRLPDGRLLWRNEAAREYQVWNGSAWVLDGRLTLADIDEGEVLTDEGVAALIRDGILPT
jgi:hypothetical protein